MTRRVLPLLVAPDTISDMARRGKPFSSCWTSCLWKWAVFLRVVAPCQHHHHLHPRKWATYAHFWGQLLFVTTITTSSWPTPPTPLKMCRLGCAHFRGWLLFAHTTTSTIHPQKQAHMLVFEGCLPPLPHLHPQKWAYTLVFEGV